MRRFLRVWAGALAALVFLTACDFSVYSLPLPGGADLGDNSYAVKVQFRDVLDLVPQSAVKVDDVTVGKVDDISLDGYTALVSLRLNGDVSLPQNSLATIRQTSLLGEKFVSLSPPVDEAATGKLADGDTIPLSRSGRNPEVEEVLAALSLLLNGGGVAQLKTISQELNKALSGNETEVRSVLGQLDEFMGQLDKNKHDIIAAIRSMNALALEVKQQKSSIINTLDSMPQALRVLNQQRSGLVKMLQGLKRLSPIAVHVIQASKQDTVANLRALDPILTKLADAGSDIPGALQVFLTYPFVNATIGNTVTEARNLHMGDYTNLSAQLNINLNDFVTLPPLPNLCEPLTALPTISGAPITLPTACPVPTNLCDLLATVPTDQLPIGLPTTTCPSTIIVNPTDVCANVPQLPAPVPSCASLTSGGLPSTSIVNSTSVLPSVTSAVCSLVDCSVTSASGFTGLPLTTSVGLPRVAPPYQRNLPTRVETAQFDEDIALLLMQGVSR